MRAAQVRRLARGESPNVHPLNVHRTAIDGYRRHAQATMSNASAKKAIPVLQSFYDYLASAEGRCREGEAANGPAHREDTARVPGGRGAVLQAARKYGPRTYALVLLLAATGARISEVHCLRLEGLQASMPWRTVGSEESTEARGRQRRPLCFSHQAMPSLGPCHLASHPSAGISSNPGRVTMALLVPVSCPRADRTLQQDSISAGQSTTACAKLIPFPNRVSGVRVTPSALPLTTPSPSLTCGFAPRHLSRQSGFVRPSPTNPAVCARILPAQVSATTTHYTWFMARGRAYDLSTVPRRRSFDSIVHFWDSLT